MLKGQLFSIEFIAPGRNNVPNDIQAEGFTYTVTGLTSNTEYQYTITAKDMESNVLDIEAGSFKTPGTATDSSELDYSNDTRVRKVMRNGSIYIITLKDEQYNIQGTEVR